jgi:hypothetical protein
MKRCLRFRTSRHQIYQTLYLMSPLYCSVGHQLSTLKWRQLSESLSLQLLLPKSLRIRVMHLKQRNFAHHLGFTLLPSGSARRLSWCVSGSSLKLGFKHSSSGNCRHTLQHKTAWDLDLHRPCERLDTQVPRPSWPFEQHNWLANLLRRAPSALSQQHM